MNPDTQAILAICAVVITFGLFIWSKARKKSSGGCGSGCGCDHKPHEHHDHAKH